MTPIEKLLANIFDGRPISDDLSLCGMAGELAVWLHANHTITTACRVEVFRAIYTLRKYAQDRCRRPRRMWITAQEVYEASIVLEQFLEWWIKSHAPYPETVWNRTVTLLVCAS